MYNILKALMDLKSHGISIHRCIGGYYKPFTWLSVAATKVSEVTAKYHLDTVKQMTRKPKIIKTDVGTDHSIIQLFHVYFSKTAVSNKIWKELSYFSKKQKLLKL